jgi:hypothetical protein
MISSTIRKVGPFVGTGLVSNFPFSFKVFASTDLKSVKADAAGGETVLVLNSDYTASLNADQDNNPGGSITLSAALPVGYTLIITTAVPETQGLQLTDLGGFYPTAINALHDKLVVLIQQAQEQIDRSLKFAATDAASGQLATAPVRANKYLAFGPDGTPIYQDSSSSVTGAINVSSLNGIVFADQYATLNSAVAALGGNPGTVMVKPGNYSVATTIQLASGQHIVGTAPAMLGQASQALTGAILTWTGANNSPVILVRDAHGVSVEGISIDCANTTGAIGIQYDSTNTPGTSYGVFKNLSIKGFTYGFVCGVPSTVADTNGYQCDTFTFENFQMYGNNGTNAIGFILNSANGGQQSVICRGNLQWVNQGIRIVKTNGGITVEDTFVGSPIGTSSTHIQADAGSAGNIYRNNETEGTFDYALHDSSTNSGFAASPALLIGNQFFRPVLVDGTIQYISIGNKGTTASYTRSGSAYVNSIGDQGLWTESGVSNKINYSHYFGTGQIATRFGVGGNAEVVNSNKNCSILIQGSGTLVGTAQRGVADVNTYTGATGSAISFQSSPITATASTPGYGFAAYDPSTSGAGTWSTYYGFYTNMTAGAGKYFLFNSNGVQSEFGGGALLGVSSTRFNGATSGTTTLQPTAAASGTLTLPAATDTLVGKATTDTLTNKTLTAPVVGGTAPTVSAGQVGLGGVTTTTVGAAGGASALPATPVGYLTVNIGGTNYKIPYFNS